MKVYDYLVIGSGIAALDFARKAAVTGRVAVVTKRNIEESNSSYAQGGVAAVWEAGDSFDSHAADTIAAGQGLCNTETVRAMVSEGPARVAELIELGVGFSRDKTNPAGFDLGLEGGHSHRRVLHANDATGREIMTALVGAVRDNPRVDIFEHHHAVDLLIDQKFGMASGRPHCWGAYVLDAGSGRIEAIRAKATFLASGGAGKVYLYTSNPDVASGDGIAMAYRAGCRVADLEFMQFHPTCLYHPEAKSFLVSEALRGEGAILKAPDGRAFMSDHDPRAELAPRDIVARAIDHEMKKAGYDNVFLDATHLDADFLRSRFPQIFEQCFGFGIDITVQPIPVVPAAHYMCGGVMTDLDGQTAVERLYAGGEVAMTGAHGANRLASNSLLEGLVFADRAARHAAGVVATPDGAPPEFPLWESGEASDIDESVVIAHNWDEVRRLMWNYVGIVRSDRRLERAAARIAMLRDEVRQYYWDFKVTDDLLELRNLVLVADLIVRSARRRRESRGLHYNIDCPERDDHDWSRHTVL